jgi:hypothetical protein
MKITLNHEKCSHGNVIVKNIYPQPGATLSKGRFFLPSFRDPVWMVVPNVFRMGENGRLIEQVPQNHGLPPSLADQLGRSRRYWNPHHRRPHRSFMMGDEIVFAEMSSFIRKWGLVLAQSGFHRQSETSEIRFNSLTLLRMSRALYPRIGRPLAISAPRGQTGRREWF